MFALIFDHLDSIRVLKSLLFVFIDRDMFFFLLLIFSVIF